MWPIRRWNNIKTNRRKNMSDMLICVDALDRPIGSADKLRCHREG